jgi:hypothetical protein
MEKRKTIRQINERQEQPRMQGEQMKKGESKIW